MSAQVETKPPITALAPWFGSNRTLAENVGRALAGCRWVGVEFVVRNAPADIYPTFAPKRDGQFFRSGNRP